MVFDRRQAASLYSHSGQRKYLTPAERVRFLDAARCCRRSELRTFCLVLAWTGCRISEALDLTCRCISVEDGFIAVTTLKRRSRSPVIREIPVPPRLMQELAMVHGIGSAGPDRPLWTFSRSRAWSLVKRVMREAGIADGPQQSPKGLRHGFGVHAIRSGIPLNLVQRWLGHASMTTTAIYLQVMGDEERAIAARMWTPQTPSAGLSAVTA